MDASELIQKIQSSDADARYAAWRAAGPAGSAAVAKLGELLASPDKGVAKAAKGALETIAYYSTRPGAAAEAEAVSRELLKIGGSQLPRGARAEAIHLLGFTADHRSVPGLAQLLNDPDMRDEARMALEQIPGGASLDALKGAVGRAPADFQPALQQSIHNRALRKGVLR